MLEKLVIKKNCIVSHSFPLTFLWREAWRLWPSAMPHLSTRVEYLVARPLSISPSDLSMGGMGVLQPWKNKPPTGMTVSSLPSSNLDHTHTRVESRSGVPDQFWPDWRRMRSRPVGTRWPFSSYTGPRSVSLQRKPRMTIWVRVKVYNSLYVWLFMSVTWGWKNRNWWGKKI